MHCQKSSSGTRFYYCIVVILFLLQCSLYIYSYAICLNLKFSRGNVALNLMLQEFFNLKYMICCIVFMNGIFVSLVIEWEKVNCLMFSRIFSGTKLPTCLSCSILSLFCRKHVIFGKLVQGHNILKKIEDVGDEEGLPSVTVKIINCGEHNEGENSFDL